MPSLLCEEQEEGLGEGQEQKGRRGEMAGVGKEGC